MENKKVIVAYLKMMLKHTRAGSYIDQMSLSDDETVVEVSFLNGGTRKINVACDSGIGIIKDVLSFF